MFDLCKQERLEKRRREKMKKARKVMAEESSQRLLEFEEKKEMELVNMKADEVTRMLYLTLISTSGSSIGITPVFRCGAAPTFHDPVQI